MHKDNPFHESSDTCQCTECARLAAIASLVPRDETPVYVVAIVLLLAIAGLCWIL